VKKKSKPRVGLCRGLRFLLEAEHGEEVCLREGENAAVGGRRQQPLQGFVVLRGALAAGERHLPHLALVQINEAGAGGLVGALVAVAAAAPTTAAPCSAVHVAVPLQSEAVAEAHVADVAPKRPLPRVHLPVVLQVRTLQTIVHFIK